MKLVRYLRGTLAGRCLVEDDDLAEQLVKQGDADYATETLEYLTREMTARKQRGRPKKVEAEPPADED